ncbi:DUF3160 domain-containing protein [Desulfovibrio sp. OttesenSCG-928-C14]|nr:DUF3160 domain-containing protein [Desulfovibrio sp. OttesenSCG-928-C14]
MRITTLCLFLLFLALPDYAFAATSQPATIPLQSITLRPFAQAPDSVPGTVPPSLSEQRFPLAAASNFPAVEKRLGGLTEVQKKYLEEHRFLLLSKKDFLYPFPDGSPHEPYDEMLRNFDSIGGSGDPMERKPERAVLVNPDVFLQALHTYFSQRLKDLEKETLSTSLHVLLTNLYANAKTLLANSGPEATAHWQRLQAQIVVPLLLLENCEKPEPDADPAKDVNDTLANALKLFVRYSGELPPELQEAVKKELTLVYAASTQQTSPLHMAPTYDSSGMIDYTQFKARGHYQSASASRAYFRAMIWLGQLGWNLQTEQGLADSVNFALAMSYDRPNSESHRQAWQHIMEISSFFVGYPDAPSYPEWQAFLARHSAAGLTAQSSADAALLQDLAGNLKEIPQPKTPFASLQTKNNLTVLTVFPQRFTIPWLVGDRLTFHDSLRPDLPAVFSGLWVPAVMGSSYADSLLTKQVELCLAAQPSATLEGGPSTHSGEGLTPTQAGQVKNAAEYFARLHKHMAVLGLALKAESQENWFSSIGSVWFHLLGTLTADYGEGYPLYMRDSAFGAKQLESFMGAFTALKHDTILYEKPNFAELGSGGEDGEIPPVPKGFVEPNLPFWHALLRAVGYMEDGFKKYTLYPKDLEKFGTLGRFKRSLELCVALAEKELRGEPLTEEEYEAIRIMKLQYMAEPMRGVITREEALSGLIVDVQTANLNDRTGAKPVIVYEALADPYIMLALVGNEKTPRVVIGMAYNHREFITPYGIRLTDGVWKKRVYGPESKSGDFTSENAQPLPGKNFWYDVLRP